MLCNIDFLFFSVFTARNVFIDADFTAKVGDFGMSKFDDRSEADKSQITFTKVGPLKVVIEFYDD